MRTRFECWDLRLRRSDVRKGFAFPVAGLLKTRERLCLEQAANWRRSLWNQ